MFFRPEENAFLSKSIDDVGIFQAAEIHVRDKDNGPAIRFPAAAIHVTVNLQLHGTFAVGAFRVDPNDHLLLPQPPLHEGRRKSVHRSSGIQPLSRVEGNTVRGLFHGHRVSPDNLPPLVPVEEGQVFFQIDQDFNDLINR